MKNQEDEERPNPEALLEAISREENRKKKGNLKIFLGMAAGVGKTYAMLESAQKLQERGINVVVGVVNTHGRKETAQLLYGLKVIPLKKIVYKDAIFEEMDLDALIKTKPAVAIVDELAHTNVPGSRHPKRWQDVLEILDNGIDVYTTLNVQHIESLKEMVESIAEIPIRETVPDSIIDSAAFIELIDIAPIELLQRLKEGKVYLGEQSEMAAKHFFQEDRLTALREILLRFAAEKVDHDLHGMVSSVERKKGWRPRERLMVAVNHTPHSSKLIRTTRRLAFNLGAPWIAIHVNDGTELSDEDQELLSKNLSLARDLGAEVITTSDIDIAQAIQRVARQKGVTQIIIGRSPKKPWFGILNRPSLFDQLARECSDIDVHVIRQSTPTVSPVKKRKSYYLTKQISSYSLIIAFVFLLGIIGAFLITSLGKELVGFGFLSSLLLLSLFFTKGPIIAAAILYDLTWVLFYYLPETGVNGDILDVLFLILTLFTGITTGILVDRIRAHKEMLIRREESIQALYEIVREIASSPSKNMLSSVKDRLGRTLNGTCEFLIKRFDNGLMLDKGYPLLQDDKEKNAAQWVFENEKEAGWSTLTLPSSKNYYVPLKGFSEVVGVLAYRPSKNQILSVEEKNFLYTVASQVGSFIERSFAEEELRRSEQLTQVDRVYQNVLSFVSDQFQHPLKKIQDTIDELREDQSGSTIKQKPHHIHKMETVSEGLARLVDNIAAMAKLSVALISVNKSMNDVEKLIRECCENVKKSINSHNLIITIQDNLPLIYFDESLIEFVIYNLVFGAFQYSPSDSTIEVEAKVNEEFFEFSITYFELSQISSASLSFTEAANPIFSGTLTDAGLGIDTSKKIAEIHQGILQTQVGQKGLKRHSLFLPLILTENER